MFGVVPKVLWSQAVTPDALNRIRLAMRCLLAIDRTSGRVILVDSGAGDKWSDVEQERFAIDVSADHLRENLQALGVAEDDVTDVVVTHLHFDHNGGLTRWSGAGTEKAVSRFRKARHWIHAQHLAHASSPTPKDRGSFYDRDFRPIQEARLFEIIEGEQALSPFEQVTWHIFHGHTPYQLLPRFADDHMQIQYCADLVPTAAHLSPAWVMAFDNEPLKTVQEKQALLAECSSKNLALFLEHDPEHTLISVDVTQRRPSIKDSLAI